jgi:hypothetical protein
MLTPTLTGTWILLAVAAATPSPTPRTARVATASELIAAIGPDRTIALAAGDYDVGTLPHTPTAHVRWEGGDVDPRLIVHDVANLTIAGPSEGTARVYASRPTGLRFEKTSGLELRRLAIGREAKILSVGESARDATLRGPEVVDSRNVTIEDLRMLPDGTSQLKLENVDGARVSRWENDRRSGLAVYGGRGLRIDDAHLRSAISILGGAKDGVVAHVTVEIDAGADAEMREALMVDAESEIALEDVRLVDTVTGKVRRHVDRGRAQAQRRYGVVPGEVKFRLLRSAPVGADPADPEYLYRLKLADGRQTFSGLRAGERQGLEPSSVRAHRLGNAGSPILIAWEDISQGQGNYQNTYYQVLGPGPNDGVLLQGSRSISGHGGMVFGGSGGIAFAFLGGFLTVREDCREFEMNQVPSPGWVGELEKDTFFDHETVTLYESIYRLREGRLEAFRFEQYVRVEPESDLARLAEDGYRPAWPHRDGSPPLNREWLKRVLSIEEGEKAHPRICSIESE